MITSEELADFEAAGIQSQIATAQKADQVEIVDVHNEVQVVHGRLGHQYMVIRWLAQNGHLIDGESKIRDEHKGGFNEDQLTLLGRSALARKLVYRQVG